MRPEVDLLWLNIKNLTIKNNKIQLKNVWKSKSNAISDDFTANWSNWIIRWIFFSFLLAIRSFWRKNYNIELMKENKETTHSTNIYSEVMELSQWWKFTLHFPVYRFSGKQLRSFHVKANFMLVLFRGKLLQMKYLSSKKICQEC